jgi:hypothetical protein
MTEIDPLDALDVAMARVDSVISHLLVDRAMHALLDVDIYQAQALEDKLERAGWARTQRGDWVRW